MLLALFLALVLFDSILLYKTDSIKGNRILPDKFSNSDENSVVLDLRNEYPMQVHLEIIDEIPLQFQKRDFLKKIRLPAKGSARTEYLLRPVERGEYYFGSLNIYCSSPLQLIKRRYSFQKEQMLKVYPSFVQMKKYDFLAIDNRISQPGLKKIRRIGHSMEFEQIKDYVLGDDVRSINWKATAKHGNLMTNQFQDERSQSIYSIIDVSRTMKMPFNNLKLLDYAINSSLAFSNIAIKRKDKVGLLSFSNKTGNLLPASNKPSHLMSILESLYNINTNFLDADFGNLYAHIRKQIPQRSLLLLYTNFEHPGSMERQLVYLRAIARTHLLIVIFFQNTELDTLIESTASNIPEVFDQTIAEDFSYQKRLMAKELERHGIQTILTRPEDLSLNTINKYLEVKARGLL